MWGESEELITKIPWELENSEEKGRYTFMITSTLGWANQGAASLLRITDYNSGMLEPFDLLSCY